MSEPRARAPRGTLTRSRIVAAAVDIADQEGIQRLTMPRVAERLGVGTMSLYRHVSGKDDLFAAVIEHIFVHLDVPEGNPYDWENRVVGYLIAWRHLALAHPALTVILANRPLHMERQEKQIEVLLEVLGRAGFPDPAKTFFALFTYVFGFVLWELPSSHNKENGAYRPPRSPSLEQLPAETETINRARQLIAASAGPDQFSYGLEALIRGLAATLPESRLTSRAVVDQSSENRSSK